MASNTAGKFSLKTVQLKIRGDSMKHKIAHAMANRNR